MGAVSFSLGLLLRVGPPGVTVLLRFAGKVKGVAHADFINKFTLLACAQVGVAQKSCRYVARIEPSVDLARLRQPFGRAAL